MKRKISIIILTALAIFAFVFLARSSYYAHQMNKNIELLTNDAVLFSKQPISTEDVFRYCFAAQHFKNFIEASKRSFFFKDYSLYKNYYAPAGLPYINKCPKQIQDYFNYLPRGHENIKTIANG